MLNWKTRYHKIIRDNPDLSIPERSILEVGGGSSGLAAYLDRKIVCLDKEFTGRLHGNIEPVIGSIDALDYDDASFDVVICVDVLEHIAKSQRRKAVSEMIRVAKEKVIISFPCKNFAEAGEIQLRNLLRQTGQPVPSWLQEHIRNGLPSLSDVISDIGEAGHIFTIVPNEGFIQHYSGIILDTLFPLAQTMYRQVETKTRSEPPVYENEWDCYYSFIITILKDKIPAAAGASASHVEEPRSSAVYAVYHQDLPTDHLSNVTPIYVGRAAAARPAGDLTDRLRDSPSLDNDRWSEMSAIYKVWKEGPRSDIVGFCHYRRLFHSEAGQREIRIRQDAIDGYRIDERSYHGLGADFIVTPAPQAISGPVFDQYCITHNANHICRMYQIIAEKKPELLPFVVRQFQKSSLYANNMFITNWENFDELCGLWFSILPQLEPDSRDSTGNRYQKRDLAFLAERLFDIWIQRKQSEGVPVIETGIYFLEFSDLDVSAWSPTR